MLTLTLLDPQASHHVQKWEFPQQSTIRIGRSPDNDVILNDVLVSRYHLEIRKIGTKEATDSWQLVSNGTNGTFVNGIMTSQASLLNNSLIQLARGGPTLKVEIIQAPIPVSIAPISPSPSCTHPGNPPSNLFCMQCGQPLVEVQRFIRQYQVLRTLGQGGMGTTYLAWDKQGTINGRPQLLVLKEMNADMAQIAKAKELFEREARILKSLHHKGIPEYYDFFVDDGKKYLAMELVHGEDLDKRIQQRGPVTLQQAIAWMMQTCEVLDYIHSQTPPLIHRDIKPANLLARYLDNRIVVLDFGAVKEIGTPQGTRIGAEGFSAPEQDRGQPCTQSDLYAIGPTLIYLVTGENPLKFFRKQGQVYRFDVKPIFTITPSLRMVIERTTEPKPPDRYQTAKELSQALAACLE